MSEWASEREMCVSQSKRLFLKSRRLLSHLAAKSDRVAGTDGGRETMESQIDGFFLVNKVTSVFNKHINSTVMSKIWDF